MIFYYSFMEGRMKKICVFCSSSDYIDKDYFSKTNEILSKIIELGFDLVYGGSSLGLMGYTAKIFHDNKRRITAIMPEKIHKAVGNPNFVEESLVVSTMHERKMKMREIADCFIALPGGFGTFEEILEVITLKQLGYLDKPIIIANINGYYDELVSAFEKMYRESFAKEEYRALYIVSDTPCEIKEYIENYVPFGDRLKW